MALPKVSRWYSVWYVLIAVGFVLLALRAYVAGASTGGVLLRVFIAIGFAALAWDQNRQWRRRNRSG